MSIQTVFSDPTTTPPLDDSLYNLSGIELEFFKSQTGIHDEDKLKRHILAAQAEAYKVRALIVFAIYGVRTLTILFAGSSTATHVSVAFPS